MTDSIDTCAVHAGAEHSLDGAAVTPVFGCTVFELDDPVASYADIRYPRLGNTRNHRAVTTKIAALEGSEAALVTASGMAAITTVLLDVLAGGGHLLASRRLYGGTQAFVHHHLPDFGMSATAIDTHRPEGWSAALKSRTRAIYVESIENPTCGIPDHGGIVAFAREHGLISIIDNTFATPVNFRPLELGYDLVVHSATKYLNGHSDLVAGAAAGSRQRLASIQHRLGQLGASLPPQACALLERGLKTLPLRMARHNANAQALARLLASDPAVRAVHYPGLPEHPDHARAQRWLAGSGGVLAFELRGGREDARALVAALRLPTYAPSLGGPETLIVRPAGSSHLSMSPAERAAAGISEGLLRVSVGLEAEADLLEDFRSGLATVAASDAPHR
jgi:cystathionine gamma-synthase/cystathionine gamma-lyase/cystathionine beta-lyase